MAGLTPCSQHHPACPAHLNPSPLLSRPRTTSPHPRTDDLAAPRHMHPAPEDTAPWHRHGSPPRSQINHHWQLDAVSRAFISEKPFVFLKKTEG